MKKSYLGVVHKDENSDFSIHFPDFPGCITAGSTIEELTFMAEEALRGHIECMEDHNYEIPNPSNYDKIVNESDGALMFMAIQVDAKSSKTKKINITLPEDVLFDIDNYLKDKRISRSAFLARLATQAIRTT
jgi:predicted RNase H-like HicB family nuclease